MTARSLGRHHLRQVRVRRCDQPDVGMERVRAAEPLELALLQDSQQFRLQLERRFANLIEEDGA
jgi:hypothetical protein